MTYELFRTLVGTTSGCEQPSLAHEDALDEQSGHDEDSICGCPIESQQMDDAERRKGDAHAAQAPAEVDMAETGDVEVDEIIDMDADDEADAGVGDKAASGAEAGGETSASRAATEGGAGSKRRRRGSKQAGGHIRQRAAAAAAAAKQ